MTKPSASSRSRIASAVARDGSFRITRPSVPVYSGYRSMAPDVSARYVTPVPPRPACRSTRASPTASMIWAATSARI